jgi:hypothetical protein
MVYCYGICYYVKYMSTVGGLQLVWGYGLVGLPDLAPGADTVFTLATLEFCSESCGWVKHLKGLGEVVSQSIEQTIIQQPTYVLPYDVDLLLRSASSFGVLQRD